VVPVNRQRGDAVIIAMLLICAALIALVVVALTECNGERKALIADCKLSGRAEYECRAMFIGYCSGGGGTYVAPVVVGGRR
jgi:hypothetical protein